MIWFNARAVFVQSIDIAGQIGEKGKRLFLPGKRGRQYLPGVQGGKTVLKKKLKVFRFFKKSGGGDVAIDVGKDGSNIGIELKIGPPRASRSSERIPAFNIEKSVYPLTIISDASKRLNGLFSGTLERLSACVTHPLIKKAPGGGKIRAIHVLAEGVQIRLRQRARFSVGSFEARPEKRRRCAGRDLPFGDFDMRSGTRSMSR